MGSIIEAATIRESLMYGPEKTRGAFLLRGMGARAVGMGEAFTAVANDATAISWNPGGLGQLNSPEVIAMYDVVGPGVGLSYIAGAMPIKKGVIGASLAAMNYGTFETYDVNGNETGNISPTDLNLAVSWGFDHSSFIGRKGWSGIGLDIVGESAAGALFGLSVGSVMPVSQQTSIGFALQHIGPSKDGYGLPTTFTFGGTYSVEKDIAFATDIVHSFRDGQTSLGLGAEISPFQDIALRWGYKMRRDQGISGFTGMTLGAGIRFEKIGFDYAYQPFGFIAQSHRISLVYGFSPRIHLEADDVKKPRVSKRKFIKQEREIEIDTLDDFALPDEAEFDVDKEYQGAVDLYKSKDYDLAIPKLTAVLKADPQHWKAWGYLGNCHYGKGDLKAAIDAYENSLSLHPDNSRLKGWVEKLRTRIEK